MNKIPLTLSFIVLIISAVVIGQTQAKEVLSRTVERCPITPSVKGTPPYPGFRSITPTNNLRRKVGLALVAKGERVYVTGKVLDKDCLPLDEALVEIWQSDSEGEMNKNSDENFTGSGRTYTNNLGEFSFITIFPGVKDKEDAPKIHFRISHPGFKTLETVMLFPEQPGNGTDKAFSRLGLVARNLITAERRDSSVNGRFARSISEEPEETFRFDIILSGENTLKRF